VSILIVFIVSFFSIYFGASVTTNWYQSLGFIWLGESVRVRVRVVQKYCSKAVEHCSSERNCSSEVLFTERCYCSKAVEHCSSERNTVHRSGALFIGGTVHQTLLLFINTVHRVLFHRHCTLVLSTEHCYCSSGTVH
jgi:hypothetical protein